MKLFKLTDDHIKLLNNMFVEWSLGYDGAPAIDTKMPYGNSNPIYDIYELLQGKKWDCDEDGEMSDDLQEQLHLLHRETEIALQIVLFTKSFEPGMYEKIDKYDSRSWRKINE